MKVFFINGMISEINNLELSTIKGIQSHMQNDNVITLTSEDGTCTQIVRRNVLNVMYKKDEVKDL